MRFSSRYPYANSSFLEHINSFMINFVKQKAIHIPMPSNDIH